MKKYSLNEGNDELVRSLLLMKYDTKKTLTENKEVLGDIVLEQDNPCPNTIDETTLKSKASRVSDLFNYMTTPFLRIAYIRERSVEILNIITELSKKNFYDSILKTCENSLKRFKMEFEREYTSGGGFTITDNLEEEFKDLIDGYIGETDPVSKRYLEEALKILNNNIEKPVKKQEDTNPEDTKCPPGQFYNPKIKKCQTTPCGGCIPSLCPKGTKLVNGKCVGGGGSSWRECTDFPLTKGCKGKLVSDIQKCVGASIDGKFGPQTERKISEKGYSTTVTKDVYDNIIKACGETNITGGEDDWRSAEEETGGTGDDFVSSSESNKNETEG